MDERFANLDQDFVTKGMHQHISEKLKKLSAVENISYLNNVYLPKIIENGEKIDEFLQQIDHIKDVVLHYDEVLCTKTNKSDFELTRNDFKMNFISTKKWQQLNIDL